MRLFIIALGIVTCTAKKGNYEEFIRKSGYSDSFDKSKSFEKFNEFKKKAQNMTKSDNRGPTDVTKDNIKKGFELFRDFSKGAADKLREGAIAEEAVETLGLMLNKDVLDDARGKLPASDRKSFDVTVSKEGEKSLREVAKSMVSDKQKRESVFDRPTMKLLVKRDNKSGLTGKYLQPKASNGAFKLPDGIDLSTTDDVTAIVHELQEGDGHWGRQANRYKIKSKVIGMQLMKDNGEEIKIENLSEADRISIRFPGFNADTPGKCAWWDTENGAWSEQGCSRTADPPQDGLGAECKCNHLTEFAIVEAVESTTTAAPAEEEGWTAADTGTVVAVGSVVSLGLYFAFVKDPNPNDKN